MCISVKFFYIDEHCYVCMKVCLAILQVIWDLLVSENCVKRNIFTSGIHLCFSSFSTVFRGRLLDQTGVLHWQRAQL